MICCTGGERCEGRRGGGGGGEGLDGWLPRVAFGGSGHLGFKGGPMPHSPALRLNATLIHVQYM